jgi:hypothetical protein
MRFCSIEKILAQNIKWKWIQIISAFSVGQKKERRGIGREKVRSQSYTLIVPP